MRSNLDWKISDLMLSFCSTAFWFFRFLYGDQARFFNDEIHIDLKHSKTGTVAMASAGENLNASQVWHWFLWQLDDCFTVTWSTCVLPWQPCI